jgi:GT2 family glycosyltransferase
VESPLQAPPVVAVVVTCDPGGWLEELLESLASQDYPNLSVLVIDANSRDDPSSRVAAVLPQAFVRRLDANHGYAASANYAIGVVEGASHFLFCHDDVVLEPDAVRVMVEEAFRSNAGVVAPKMLDWDDPRLLVQVGMAADKGGAPVSLVERGELDQAQHDAVRDVFTAPGGCTLVRADLFVALGGFDPAMYLYGEDLDLSWRAHIAGARVIVAPAARIRHMEATCTGRRRVANVAQEPGSPVGRLDGALPPPRQLQLQHRLRAVLKAYSRWHLVRVLPQLVLFSVAEAIGGLLTGRIGPLRDALAAWSWNLRRLGEIRGARRQVRRTRRMGDAEVRALQAREVTRLRTFLGRELLPEEDVVTPAADRLRTWMAEATGDASLRLRLTVGLAVAAVLLVGSRELVSGGVPSIHLLAPFPESPMAFLRVFFSGWRDVGLGSQDPAPLAFGLLGAGGLLLAGSTGLLQTALVLAGLPVGIIGAYRLARPIGSLRARLATLVAYAAVPVPYNALAGGRLSGVLVYGAAPWVLGRLFRSTGVAPWGAGSADRRTVRQQLLGLGLILGAVGAFAPSVVFMTLLAAVGLVVGSMLGGEERLLARSVAVAAGAAAIAAALLFPWTLALVVRGLRLSELAGGDSPAGTGFGLGAMLRFDTGPLGDPPLGWMLVTAAALPILAGRRWRLAWASRLWGLALLCWGAAWAGSRAELLSMSAVDSALAPAGLAMALCVGLGMAAFEADVPHYRFGWRQVASVGACAAIALAGLPIVRSAVGGRWDLPENDFAELLSYMPDQAGDGSFRVLWLGNPQALPLGSWRLGDGLGYATSRGGPPDATSLWPGRSPGSSRLIGNAVEVALQRGTNRLGRLLAPMAVRYVVVPFRAAPAESNSQLLPPPPGVAPALEAQADLRQLASDDALLVYENASWIPGIARLSLSAAQAIGDGGPDPFRNVDRSGIEPVLVRRRSPTRFEGQLREGDVVFLSEVFSERWKLEVAGRTAPRTEAFGWANAFMVPATGRAVLRYRTSPLRWGAILIGVVVWWVVIRSFRRSREVRQAGQTSQAGRTGQNIPPTPSTHVEQMGVGQSRRAGTVEATR